MLTIVNMGKIKIKDGDDSAQVPDGLPIKDACEELGLPFSCRNGMCATCLMDVTNGQENLSDLTRAEEIMGLDREHRLACQCKMKSGEVEIDF